MHLDAEVGECIAEALALFKANIGCCVCVFCPRGGDPKDRKGLMLSLVRPTTARVQCLRRKPAGCPVPEWLGFSHQIGVEIVIRAEERRRVTLFSQTSGAQW